MLYRICQEVDVEEKEKSPKKTHLKPSALFCKMLIDKVLRFLVFCPCPRRRTLLKGYPTAYVQ